VNPDPQCEVCAHRDMVLVMCPWCGCMTCEWCADEVPPPCCKAET
jgi:hypothetical protein